MIAATMGSVEAKNHPARDIFPHPHRRMRYLGTLKRQWCTNNRAATGMDERSPAS
jgi:hypothetical protein